MLPSLRLFVHSTQNNPMTSSTITTAAVAQAAATAGGCGGEGAAAWGVGKGSVVFRQGHLISQVGM